MFKEIKPEDVAPNEIITVSEADVSTGLREYNVRELEAQNLTAICTVKGDTPEEKALVFNAANNPQHKINDFINKKIMVKDFYAETLALVNEETGEVEKAPEFQSCRSYYRRCFDKRTKSRCCKSLRSLPERNRRKNSCSLVRSSSWLVG